MSRFWASGSLGVWLRAVRWISALTLSAHLETLALGQGSINRPDPPSTAAPLQADSMQASAEAELSSHLTTVRTQAADPSFPIAEREDRVLEMGATLDRAAEVSKNPETARRRWAEAIDLLDWFTKENPETPGVVQLQLQAANFRWAQAKSWQESGRTAGTDGAFRQRAIGALEETISRLRPLASAKTAQGLADNLRFRLARALCDRASFEPEGSKARKAGEAEALALLDRAPGAESTMAGFWHLLRAELLRDASRLAEAVNEVDAAAKSSSPPPERQLLEIKVPLLTEEKRYDDAAKAVEASGLEKSFKGLLLVRVALAHLASATNAAERSRVESDLFRWLKNYQTKSSADTRLALLELARSEIEPGDKADPTVYGAMAEAYQIAGNLAKAGDFALRAADHAMALGKVEDAAKYRTESGALLYQTGKFIEAEKVFSAVADDPKAGAMRPRAGMLRALAIGRALNARLPGATTARYTLALEKQVKEFPNDASSDQAKWLLGGLAVRSGDRDKAEALLAAIAPNSSRWVDSRLAIAVADREELDRMQIVADKEKMGERYKRAHEFLSKSLEKTKDERARAVLLLALARLDLTPIVGAPEEARELCDRVLKLPGNAGIHYRAMLYRLVATVQMGKYVEAEREALSHSSWSVATEIDKLLDALRLLDQCAATASTDLRQRRFGLVMKLLVEPLLQIDAKLSSEQRGEIRLRMTRAYLFVGDDREARRSITAWKGLPETGGDRLLRELGDTYARLQVYSLEIDVQRLRLQSNPPGSPTWFDARYALALAYYNTGQFKDAAQLIDGTAIVHPDLGGGALKAKFERLRQRIATRP